MRCLISIDSGPALPEIRLQPVPITLNPRRVGEGRALQIDIAIPYDQFRTSADGVFGSPSKRAAVFRPFPLCGECL
jgi:hypothetical protein